MTALSEVAEQLKTAREQAGLTQAEIASRAGLNRLTVGRMENLTRGDMSVSAVLRFLEAAGYDLKVAKIGHSRTLEDILAEQRSGDAVNAPGLSVGGRKTWAPGETLERFFKARLGIAPSQYRIMVERLCESAVEVGQEVIEAAKNDSEVLARRGPKRRQAAPAAKTSARKRR
jgi:transcriptional regulator with XRE-family HTH domain